jgi:NADPH-dependent 2,4-dienoyl-CoA reductase/sulfur reductase-like enzyme
MSRSNEDGVRMDEYEIESKTTGLRNWVVPVRGTNVTVYLGRRNSRPDYWAYSVWANDNDLISTDFLEIPSELVQPTPEQVAEIAFILSTG